MFCHNCGNKIEEGVQFCHSCGRAVSGNDQSLDQQKTIKQSIGQKQTSAGRKFFAFFVGWFCAGIAWYFFEKIGWTDSDNNIVGTLVALFVTMAIWIKLYRYYVDKWAKTIIVSTPK